MKKFFRPLQLFKSLSILILTVVLMLTPCGVKQSVKQVFNVENLTSNKSSFASSCEFTPLKNVQKSTQVETKKEGIQQYKTTFSPQNFVSISVKAGFQKARSIPLYILYHQLRSFLV